jgi:hypothetical protein
MAGENSSFYSSHSPETTPCFDGNEIEDGENDKIDSQKAMIRIFWDVDRLHPIEFLFDAFRFKSQHFSDVLLPTLNQSMPGPRAIYQYLPRLIDARHMGNASIYTAHVSEEKLESYGFEQMRHCPYSPDLAPSDACFFESVKKVSLIGILKTEEP